jgi:phage terminase large subunit-like protein
MIVVLRLNYGVECVAFQQNLMAISPPTKEIERLILSGEIEHDGNPCLRWMYSNVELYRDNNDNYRPIKGKSKEKKIDGVIADIIAVGIWKNAMAQPIIRSSYIDG